MQIKKALFFRHQQVLRIRQKLEQGGYPRVMMFVLLMSVSCAGFVASYLLLQAGLTTIWLRYLVAFGISYLMFIFLLWLWLRIRHVDDVGLFDGISIDPDGLAHPVRLVGQGGSFDGGGASADWSVAAMPDASADLSGIDAGPLGEAAASLSDADEAVLPLAVLIIVGVICCGLAIVASFIVYSAPLFFAELLFDGIVAVGIYKRLGGFSPRHWLETVVQRTWMPLLAGCAFFAVLGWIIARIVPGAVSLADLAVLMK